MTATILIVDDLEQNVKLLEAKLLSEYYTVFTAYNGASALQILQENKIDVVLLDVMMPGMDGLEVCLRIKSSPQTTHIPVVMVTALSETEDRIKGLQAGADEFLTKPINDVALFTRVRSLARMKTVIDELKLRNNINQELGKELIVPKEDFQDSKILIIDDDVVQVKGLKQNLSTLTSHIKIINNSQEVDHLGDFVPDLVIISCQIETEDPLRIGVKLKSKILFKNAVLMLLAEDDNISLVMKGLELGINDYFLYPIDKSELQARVKTQLRRKQYQDGLRLELEESFDLSTQDVLTNIFNRRYFDIHISQMVEKFNKTANKLSLIMLDIDFFKQVNDNYGHQAGDIVLKTLANILKQNVRVTDLVARYGGEEFVILLGNTTYQEAQVIAEKLRHLIEQTEVDIPNQTAPLKSTVSLGVAEYIKDDTINSFIDRADKALYKAKNNGRNQVC